MDRNKLLHDATLWAREAGNALLGYFRSGNLNITAKFNDSDIVTAADKAAERILLNHIHTTYPTHGILSEESGEERESSDGYRWVIDPLDGTTNFSAGLPQFSVSIGIELNGETIIGLVYAPYLNELFYAVKGEGAFLNGKPISTSDNSILARAVVTTGFPVDKDRTGDNNLDNVSRVLPHVRGMRRLGSAALDLCYVAAGFLDGYWELNLHPWDVCAGLLILTEAGGKFKYFRDNRNISILAASPGIYPSLSPLIS